MTPSVPPVSPPRHCSHLNHARSSPQRRFTRRVSHQTLQRPPAQEARRQPEASLLGGLGSLTISPEDARGEGEGSDDGRRDRRCCMGDDLSRERGRMRRVRKCCCPPSVASMVQGMGRGEGGRETVRWRGKKKESRGGDAFRGKEAGGEGGRQGRRKEGRRKEGGREGGRRGRKEDGRWRGDKGGRGGG